MRKYKMILLISSETGDRDSSDGDGGSPVAR